MSVYQFCRIESFSLKGSAKKKSSGSNAQFKNWTAESVIGEALRNPKNCKHVEKPLPPIIIFGSEDHLKKSLKDYVKNTKTASGKKLRTDALCLGSFVASYPGKAIGDDFEEWEKATLAFVQEKWGTRLRLAVRHEDESNPHIHFLLVENAGTEFRLDPIKDAHRRATEQARAKSISDKEVSLKEKNEAAIAAGESLNLEYFEKVSKRFGHLKDAGLNARTRKPREVHIAKKLAEETIAKAQEQAKQIVESIEPAKIELLETVQNLQESKQDLLSVQSRATEIKKKAVALKKQAEQQAEKVKLEKQAIEQADPIKFKRTIGRFLFQLATRFVFVLAMLIARPRQTKLRKMFIRTKKKVAELKNNNELLNIQNEQLAKKHFEHIEEKKQLREQVQEFKEENKQLKEKLVELQPTPSNVHKLAKKLSIK